MSGPGSPTRFSQGEFEVSHVVSGLFTTSLRLILSHPDLTRTPRRNDHSGVHYGYDDKESDTKLKFLNVSKNVSEIRY